MANQAVGSATALADSEAVSHSADLRATLLSFADDESRSHESSRQVRVVRIMDDVDDNLLLTLTSAAGEFDFETSDPITLNELTTLAAVDAAYNELFDLDVSVPINFNERQ